MSIPGWQTEELQDEWVDLEPTDGEDEENALSFGTHSLSLTTPLATHIHTSNDIEAQTTSANTSNHAAGTFLIREDVPDAPFIPKTPGRKKGLVKDIFTPLPLERMFEPPSPPEPRLLYSTHTGPLQTSGHPPSPSHPPERDEVIDTDNTKVVSSDGCKPGVTCKFTFTVPKGLTATSHAAFPQAQSTPNPPITFQPKPPSTDPRLRLFQFQYDTYTREHLSAMVDSIAINTPSVTGTTHSPATFTHHLSRVSELTGPASCADVSHLRSAKRVKLSPLTDYYGEGAGSQAVISRPKLTGKDYVGESKQLMQQIKSARDFSTISTTVSAPNNSSPISHADAQEVPKSRAPSTTDSSRQPVHLKIPSNVDSNLSTSSRSIGSKQSQYSSSSYRKQAEALMAQIKQDMKGQKRIFSGETETSHVDAHSGSWIAPPSPQSTSNEIIQSHLSLGFNKGAQKLSSSVSRRSSSSRSSHRCISSQIPNNRRGASRPGQHDLADELSGVSLSERPPSHYRANVIVQEEPPPLSTLAPPSYPSASRATEDMNRFVSSSTAGGTTVTSGSVPSFVKHPGLTQIRTIAPQDIPSLPDRFGDMVFDRVNSRWVKNMTGDISNVPEELSEDPFIDIDSLRDDSRAGRDRDGTDGSEDGTVRQGLHSVINEMSRIEERSEVDDEEVDLMSFSTDASSHVVSVMTGINPNAIEDDAGTTDSEDNIELVQPEIRPLEFDSEDEDFHSIDVPNLVVVQETDLASPSNLVPPLILSSLATPHRSSGTSQAAPVVRSVLKSHALTPASALKHPNRSKYQTPLRERIHRRSVSFSDGKLDGPIQGLHDSSDLTATPFSLEETDVGVNIASGIVPSARSKRIEGMMNALEDSDLCEGDSSPSKGGSIRGEGLQPPSAQQSNEYPDTSRRVFSRSQSHRPVVSKQDLSRVNGTFLTECSFGVAHDRLVAVITDVQPFEPYWEKLTSVDLSRKNLESVARLKEFLPRLDALSLNSNQLAWLSGVPGSVRTLSVASNSLTGLTSFSHLFNIENLDISRNDLDSLRQLECLRHLRELKADHNKITSLDGLQNMDGLVKLSLQGNLMQSVELGKFKWKRLEMINVSQNCLECVTGVETLQSLVALNLDNNCLRTLEVDGSMPRLRILRLSGNRLRQVDVGAFANLRTLYADNNSLTHLVKLNRLAKLENLSLRNQSGRGLSVLTRDVRDVKRLYLSGNPLQPTFISEACYNMIYLEVAACRLTALPEDMGKLTPNLRVLNLNYNFLEDARPLEGLTRLEKLTIIGSRLKKTKPLIRLVQRMHDIEMLDFRMNPCTLGWYLPLLVKDVPGALQPSESKNRISSGEQPRGHAQEKTSSSWQELDAKFRRDLPDELYIGRLAYRGLIMRACGRMRMLDGVGVSEKERTKAQKLLMGILSKNKKKREG